MTDKENSNLLKTDKLWHDLRYLKIDVQNILGEIQGLKDNISKLKEELKEKHEFIEENIKRYLNGKVLLNKYKCPDCKGYGSKEIELVYPCDCCYGTHSSNEDCLRCNKTGYLWI